MQQQAALSPLVTVASLWPGRPDPSCIWVQGLAGQGSSGNLQLGKVGGPGSTALRPPLCRATPVRNHKTRPSYISVLRHGSLPPPGSRVTATNAAAPVRRPAGGSVDSGGHCDSGGQCGQRGQCGHGRQHGQRGAVWTMVGSMPDSAHESAQPWPRHRTVAQGQCGCCRQVLGLGPGALSDGGG